MITVAEIRALAGEWGLREDVVEKDYVLGWLLAGIAAEPDLARTWVFKGGTCLRKCYYETYRFSEDLDFTVTGGGPETPDDLRPAFERVSAWLFDRCGLEIVLDEASFRRRKNRRGNPTTEGRLGFRGPRRPPQLPKVKLDITGDEAIVNQPELRLVAHPYSDAPADPHPSVGEVACYPIVDLFAEKIRALAQRCRPRDLYDVVHVHRHPDLIGRSAPVLAALAQKCAHAGIAVPSAETIKSSPYRREVETEWGNMLGHQLPHLPPFDDFWAAIDDVFAWLDGRSLIQLPRAETADAGLLDPSWVPPRAMASWHLGAPLELIRFAGANRMKVELDYRAAEGRHGPRIVEPYALRLTRDGNLILIVVNDYGALRGYRVDRIAGARIIDQRFSPRYSIEF